MISTKSRDDIGSLSLEEAQAFLQDVRGSAERLREAERIARVGSWSLDLLRGELIWSDEVFRIFEIDQNLFSATYEGFLEAVHPDDREAVHEAYTMSLVTRCPYEITHRLRMGDGRIKWLHEKCETEFDAAGKAVLSRGIVQDVTARKHAEDDLVAARNRLQALVSAIPDLLFEVGIDGRIHSYHAHRLDLLAAPPKVFLGKRFADVLPAEAAEVCSKAIADAAENGRSAGATYSVPLPQGIRWFDISVAALPENGRDERRFICLARDITAHKNAEDALRGSEARWRSLVENAPNFIVLVDRQLRYTYINRMQPDLAVEDFVGRSALETVADEDRAEVRQCYERVFETGQSVMVEFRAVVGPGQMGWYQVHVGPVRESQRVESLLIVSSDITARKRAEEELRIAAAAFECQDAIVILDDKFNILRVNQAFGRMCGHELGYAGKHVFSILRPVRSKTVSRDAVCYMAMHGGGWQGELWLARMDDREFFGRMSFTAVRDGTGPVSHYVVNVSDVTDAHLQEQQRLRMEAAHREALVREVHHRIKNCLQGVTGLLLQASLDNPAITTQIHQAVAQVNSISVLHGLLGRSNSSSVRLCDVTEAVIEEIQRIWQQRIVLTIEQPWTKCRFSESEGVPAALVLNELIVNAVKHNANTGEGVQVTLSRGPQPDSAQVRIVNRGALSPDGGGVVAPHRGLQLVSALLPPKGAQLTHQQQGAYVVASLVLSLPAITFEQ